MSRSNIKTNSPKIKYLIQKSDNFEGLNKSSDTLEDSEKINQDTNTYNPPKLEEIDKPVKKTATSEMDMKTLTDVFGSKETAWIYRGQKYLESGDYDGLQKFVNQYNTTTKNKAIKLGIFNPTQAELDIIANNSHDIPTLYSELSNLYESDSKYKRKIRPFNFYQMSPDQQIDFLSGASRISFLHSGNTARSQGNIEERTIDGDVPFSILVKTVYDPITGKSKDLTFKSELSQGFTREQLAQIKTTLNPESKKLGRDNDSLLQHDHSTPLVDLITKLVNNSGGNLDRLLLNVLKGAGNKGMQQISATENYAKGVNYTERLFINPENIQDAATLVQNSLGQFNGYDISLATKKLGIPVLLEKNGVRYVLDPEKLFDDVTVKQARKRAGKAFGLNTLEDYYIVAGDKNVDLTADVQKSIDTLSKILRTPYAHLKNGGILNKLKLTLYES